MAELRCCPGVYSSKVILGNAGLGAGRRKQGKQPEGWCGAVKGRIRSQKTLLPGTNQKRIFLLNCSQ